MKRSALAISFALLAILLGIAPAASGDIAPDQRRPFIETLSNTAPLTFGMSEQEAAAALGVSLVRISGKPGNELLAAVRPSPVYVNREARLFLQFRNHRLTGWKGDWARNWMWE